MCREAYPYLLDMAAAVVALLFDCREFVEIITLFCGHSEKDPPVPIPNTDVKLLSADGTAWATMWESRSPQNSFSIPLHLCTK